MRTLIALLCTLAFFASPVPAQDKSPEWLWVYFGTYTGPKSKGIHVAKLDLKTGKLSAPQLAGEATSPSFVALHPSGKFLYAVSEAGRAGIVAAFSVNSETGLLTKLNDQPSNGSGPCHLIVDAAGKNVLVANYGSGSVGVIPIAEDGKLAPPTCKIQHEGSSVNPQRQKGPHAHSINLDKANRFAFVADLGLDKVMVYRFDGAKGTLVANDPPAGVVAPGSGPRHFAFHPDGKHAYVINEMLNTLTAFNYDPEKGTLSEIHTVKTLPADFTGNNSTAEVQVHPSGKLVFGSNRGHNSIAVFAVEDGGKLKPLGHVSTQGQTPRNFGIDPTGQYLIAANQGTHNVAVFRIDIAAGTLTQVGDAYEVGSPVCVKFLAPR